MKKLFLSILIMSSVFGSYAQDLNSYKYVLIPETYEFTGEVDQYQLNSLTKFLFEKEGFETLMTTSKRPADLKQDPCLALTPRVSNNSGIFVTKLVILLNNCSGETVFRSEEGRSREKDFKTAYQEALRDAFKSIKELDYHYTGSPTEPVIAEEKESPEERPEIAVKETPQTPELEEDEAPKPVEIAKEPKAIVDAEEVSKPADAEKAMIGKIFEYNDQQYLLKSTAEGYGLYMGNSPEPIALLLKSGNGDSFIYNSLSNQGIAYFDKQGNLVVEYLNRQNNKKTTIVYLKKG